MILEVSDRFNKFPHEVSELSVEEFSYCIAIMNVKSDEERKAYKEAEQKAKLNRPSRRR